MLGNKYICIWPKNKHGFCQPKTRLLGASEAAGGKSFWKETKCDQCVLMPLLIFATCKNLLVVVSTRLLLFCALPLLRENSPPPMMQQQLASAVMPWLPEVASWASTSSRCCSCMAVVAALSRKESCAPPSLCYQTLNFLFSGLLESCHC